MAWQKKHKNVCPGS